MDAGPTNDQGSATVVAPSPRRASEAVPSVTVRAHQVGPWTVVEVDGEMDIQVVALVADLVGSDCTSVVFELGTVTFIDAAGLGLLVGMQRRALQVGRSVRVVAPSRSVRRLLMLTGSARTFLTFDSLGAALATPPADPGPAPAS